jgi:hypothetical protein
MPYNIFERSVYENLSTEDLINFNNNICNFQIDIVQSILDNANYKHHLLIKDKNYRYDFFKLKRKNKEDLIDGFHYLLESLNELYPYDTYPIQFIEELIGSHFLYYPDTFFELIDFYTLKGKIDGRE